MVKAGLVNELTVIFLMYWLLEGEKENNGTMTCYHLPVPAQEAIRKLKITNILARHDKFLEVIVLVNTANKYIIQNKNQEGRCYWYFHKCYKKEQ